MHQQPGFPAHLAIEEFHPQAVAILRPFPKFGQRTHEAVVGQNFDVATKLVWPFLDCLLHAPLARLDHVDCARIVAFHSAGNLAGKTARIVRVGQFDIVDGPPRIAQFGCEVAHRGEDQHDLLLVMAHIGRLVPHLHHQDDGVVLRAPSQRGDGSGQLVAQDGDENGAFGGRWHQRSIGREPQCSDLRRMDPPRMCIRDPIRLLCSRPLPPRARSGSRLPLRCRALW